jgi:hypothetical protein
LRRIRITQSARNMRSTIGSAVAVHWKKEMVVPVSSSINPIPMRFGGLPIGVMRPPTDAP